MSEQIDLSYLVQNTSQTARKLSD